MKHFYSLFFFLLSLSLFAQGEANNWYFGQFAGVTFNTNPPTALLDGQLTTLEGCSSISDTSGNLVFYTDGRTVWDKEHNIMPNADYFGGTGLMGDPSSTSSGLIVPHPTQPNLYYIFTVDEPHQQNANAYPNQGPADEFGNPLSNYVEGSNFTIPQEDDGFNNGFNYSLVDMNLRNGLGDVVANQRNIPLVTYDENDPEEIKYKCAEKITAVVNENCNSIWVITHFINRFYAFSIDENGVDTNPVITEVGPTIPLSSYRRGALGYLKASPKGNKLIAANLQNTNAPSPPFSGNVYLFDFDNATGEVLNPLELTQDVRAYGVEFSPDSNVAYAVVSGSLMQWDLQADDIPASLFTIENLTPQETAIQLAPNGKIYLPQFLSNRLNVINFPNNLGTSMGYSTEVNNGAIDLGNRTATIGLPPFIQSIFTSRVGIIEENEDTQIETQLQLCEGETFVLTYEHDTEANYQWFENGTIIEGATGTTLEIPINNDSLNLNYTLDVLPTNGDCKLSGIANVVINPLPEVQNTSLTSCVTNIEEFTSVFNLRLAEDNVLADGLAVQDFTFSYFLTEEDALLNENALQNENNYTGNDNQVVFVRVENLVSRCFSVAEINLTIGDFLEGETYELLRCDDDLNGIQSFDLTEIEENLAQEVSGFYNSINDALNQTNPLTSIQNYSNQTVYEEVVYYRIENEDCGRIGEIILIVDNLPMLSETLQFIYCLESFPQTITIQPSIDASQASNYAYFWPQTSETTYAIEINEVGMYSVLVTDLATGCENIQEFEVIGANLASFTVQTQDATRFDNRIEIILNTISIGDYEFALNNPDGPYQDSPVFDHLLPGFYTVYVREINGCGIVERDVALLGIMQFFTPNADGANDTWRILGLDRNSKARIRIFDRFGKLLREFDEANQGWDGTYNGKPMVNNDYWYAVHLEDGRILRGNFTLKR